MYSEDELIIFLKESNAIENVWDKKSLEDAFIAWQFIIKKNKLTLEDVLNTHKILMKNKDIEEKYKGALRDIDVMIAGRLGEPPEILDREMKTWIGLVNTTIKMPHSLNVNFGDKIKRDHIFFEKMHPFVDGNGRLGRILLNWERIRSKMELLVIYEKDKFAYYHWFDEIPVDLSQI